MPLVMSLLEMPLPLLSSYSEYVQFFPARVNFTPACRPRLIARERTERRRLRISCPAAMTDEWRRYAAKAGTAHKAMMPMIAMTTRSSMRVMPLSRLNTRSPSSDAVVEAKTAAPHARGGLWRDGALSRRGGGRFGLLGGPAAGAAGVDLRGKRGLAVDSDPGREALERLLAEALDLHQVRGL